MPQKNVTVIFFVLAISLTGFTACRRAQQLSPSAAQPGAAEKQARFRACIPDAEAPGKAHFALAAIRNEPDKTTARMVVYATTEAAEFYLPQYYMSRGRWLINERARSYIRDENCREYKLQDRTPMVGQVPDSGLIKLKAGEAYEVLLSFPRLEDNVRQGVLVYGKWVMPFVLNE